MSEYEISKTTVNGFTVVISYDPDPQSPHEDGYRGADMVLSLKGYDLPNDAGVDTGPDGMDASELAEYVRTELGAYLVLPVWGYIHSGIALTAGERTYPFDCPWDSGMAGVAYVTPRIWEYCQGTPWTGSQDDLDKATALITAHVDLYGKYLNGECYSYTVEDWDGEYIDGCGGFYDIDEAEAEAAEVANHAEHTPKCTGALDRVTGTIEHDGDCPVHNPPTLDCPHCGGRHYEQAGIENCAADRESENDG